MTEPEWRAAVATGPLRVVRNCAGCDPGHGTVQRVIDGQALVLWDDGQRGYTDLPNLDIVT